MDDHEENRDDRSEDEPADTRTVELMPLSDEQVVGFSRERGVDDPERLLEDLQRRNAREFARGPQDLIELCADWREHERIRTHRDQVATNVRVKLRPRKDGREPAELSADTAIEGASRLVLTSHVTRCLTNPPAIERAGPERAFTHGRARQRPTDSLAPDCRSRLAAPGARQAFRAS
ncbi:MAG: hypothetical protein OXI03_02040 [Chloroflexota bacterium]|nr:hypothetical protein [Chloroflexota bacterium]